MEGTMTDPTDLIARCLAEVERREEVCDLVHGYSPEAVESRCNAGGWSTWLGRWGSHARTAYPALLAHMRRRLEAIRYQRDCPDTDAQRAYHDMTRAELLSIADALEVESEGHRPDRPLSG